MGDDSLEEEVSVLRPPPPPRGSPAGAEREGLGDGSLEVGIAYVGLLVHPPEARPIGWSLYCDRCSTCAPWQSSPRSNLEATVDHLHWVDVGFLVEQRLHQDHVGQGEPEEEEGSRAAVAG